MKAGIFMSLKINRQANLEELFNKFAVDPLAKPLSKEEAARTNQPQEKKTADDADSREQHPKK